MNAMYLFFLDTYVIQFQDFLSNILSKSKKTTRNSWPKLTRGKSWLTSNAWFLHECSKAITFCLENKLS